MTILIFAHELYEDLELWYPKIRLEEAGVKTVVAGPEQGKIVLGKHGYPCRVDVSLEQIQSHSIAGVLIPGGYAPDKLRRVPAVLQIVKHCFEHQRMVAFICHGGWVPISAKILKGRRATGTAAIKDDLENSGAIWCDEPVVVDGHLISSRTPIDLPHFCKAMLHFLHATHK
jgi:protease I